MVLEDDVENPVLERFRLILTFRYLSTQLLLYRPILSALLNSAIGDNPKPSRGRFTRVEKDFSRHCMEAAEDLITIIHHVLIRPTIGKRLVGAWWFTLYYSQIP